MEVKEIHTIIHGRVQMVMYRDFVARKARHLTLTGFVRNLDNETVEVVAQGEEGKLQKLVEHLNRGSLLSHVERVNVEWREPIKTHDTFEIVF